MQCLYISAEDTRALVGLDDGMRLVEEVFWMHARGEVRWSSPTTLGLRDPDRRTTFRLKACELPAVGLVGVRVTGYHTDAFGVGSGSPDNTRWVILSELATARPLAIVDEHWNYNLRTCASAVLGLMRLMAPAAEHRLGLVGAGNLAETSLRLLARYTRLGRVAVYSRRRESREGFAARLGPELGVPVEPVEGVRQAISGADLVVTATSADQRLVEESWLEPGTTLVTLGQGELADACYTRADKVVVDDLEVASTGGDVQDLIRRGVLRREDIYAAMPEVIAGQKGRGSEEERIILRADGMVSQDVWLAHYAWERARATGRGITVTSG